MKHIVSRMSSYFPNRWPLSYLNLIKNMKTYIRRQQHKKKFKHQDIKQKEPPQKYRHGTISNTKLFAGLNRFYRILFLSFIVDTTYELISKYNVGLKTLLGEGLSEPEFYGDLVYKLKKLIGRNGFSFQFRKKSLHVTDG